MILREQGISLAGQPYSKKLKDGETVRVMTGAVIPDNSDAVIMKEMTNLKSNMISVAKFYAKKSEYKKYWRRYKKG